MLRQSLVGIVGALGIGVAVAGWVCGQPAPAPLALETVPVPPAASAPPPAVAPAPPVVPGRKVIATGVPLPPGATPPAPAVAVPVAVPGPLAASVIANSIPPAPQPAGERDLSAPDDGLPVRPSAIQPPVAGPGVPLAVMPVVAPSKLPNVVEHAVYQPPPDRTAPHVDAAVRPVVFQPPDSVAPPPYQPGSDGGGGTPAPREPSPPAAGSLPPRGPALALETTMPAETALGQALVCEIIVRNTGSAPAAAVRVEAPLPTGTRLVQSQPAAEEKNDRLTWGLGDLEARGERRLRVELQTRADGEVVLSPTAAFEATATRTRVVRPPFAVSVTGPESAAPGAEVVFHIQVSNRQATPVTHVIVRDQLPPGLKHPAGSLVQADFDTLGANQTRTLDLKAVAVQSGRLVNAVSARADGGLQASATTAVLVAEPKVSLHLDGPRQTAANRDLDFQLDVTNPGGSPVKGVRLTQAVPEGLEFVTASTAGSYNPAGHAIEWVLGTLAGGQTQAVTFKLRARLAGDWAMPAKAAADGVAETAAVHAVHVDGAPELTLEVRAVENPVAVGAETTYEMHVVNQGAAPSSGLKLAVSVPESLELLRPEGPTAGAVNRQQVTFEPLAQLAPHTEALYRLRVRGRQEGDGRFRAEVSGGTLKQPVVEEVSTRVGTRAPGWNAPRADNAR